MTLISSERLYTGRIVNLDRDTVRFPDGSTGQLEMLRHPGASAVVPFLDDPRDPDPRVLLIRQFRHAAEAFIWEVPAGRLDPGESPEACARRELEEETGMRASAVERLTTIYTTPGIHRRADSPVHGEGAGAGIPAARGGRVHGGGSPPLVGGRAADPLGGDSGRENLNGSNVCSMF